MPSCLNHSIIREDPQCYEVSFTDFLHAGGVCALYSHCWVFLVSTFVVAVEAVLINCSSLRPINFSAQKWGESSFGDARLAPIGISDSDIKSGRDDCVQINNFLKGKVITVRLLNFSCNCNTEVNLRTGCKTGLEMTIFRYDFTSDVDPSI